MTSVDPEPAIVPYRRMSTANPDGIVLEILQDPHTGVTAGFDLPGGVWDATDEYATYLETALGCGFGKRIRQIEKAEVVEPGQWRLTGIMSLFGHPQNRFTIDVDQDLIVRKALIESIAPTKWFYRYRMVTDGRFEAGDLICAKQGKMTRSKVDADGVEEIIIEEEVDVVDVEVALSDSQYKKLTTTTIPANAIERDPHNLNPDPDPEIK